MQNNEDPPSQRKPVNARDPSSILVEMGLRSLRKKLEAKLRVGVEYLADKPHRTGDLQSDKYQKANNTHKNSKGYKASWGRGNAALATRAGDDYGGYSLRWSWRRMVVAAGRIAGPAVSPGEQIWTGRPPQESARKRGGRTREGRGPSEGP